MKQAVIVLIGLTLSSFFAKANDLKCDSDTSRSIREIVTVAKLKHSSSTELGQAIRAVSDQAKDAKTCEEVDRANLAAIALAISVSEAE